MADLSKIKLNGTEYDLKDAVARNLLHIINMELTGDTYNGSPVGQLNCSQEELKNYYENGLCVFQFQKDENTYIYRQISDYDSTFSQWLSSSMNETLDVYNIHGIITQDMDGGLLAECSIIIVKSDGTCLIDSSRHMIPKIIGTTSGRGIYNEVTGELDMSNIVINSDLATVATSGDYNDLTNKPTIPEDKLFLVNVTWDDNLVGTSDKSSAEIAAAVNAGKLPIVKTGLAQMSMIATLVNIEEKQKNEETYYTATFMYNDENIAHTSLPTFITKAVMIISGTNVRLQMNTGSYVTNYELEEKGYLTSYTETDPTVPAWAKQTSKPTYSFSELTSHPTTINDYGITDAYTKTEINGLISSVLHYKGTKATVDALPSNNNVIGDVWHVTANGSEWAWDGTNWQELGTAVDLSAYRTAAAQDAIDDAQDEAIAAKYIKPSGGIPASDLAAGVIPTVPTKTSDLTNDSNFVNAAGAAAAAPVQSVNGKTGAVNLTIPAAQVQSDWNATSGMGVILNKPNLSTFMVKGTDYVTAGQKSGTTLGNKATAEGTNTTASGDYSHAEGQSTTASGIFSHAEGYYTDASRDSSHAEGHNTTASGVSSHAEGTNTTASGNYSHAEGTNTTAQGRSQHVFGEYNILDTTGTTTTKGQYVEIVGNGTSSTRSNARTLDWSGNEVLAGKLTIGTAPTADMDVTTKQYVDNAITTAIGGINQFEVAIVTDLPTTDIDAHTIYFKSNSSSGNNIYDEYMYINSNWELIGSTQVDLSNYLQTSDIAAWAKAANKPTYTAAEVGALPSTYTAPVTSVNGQTGEVNLTIPAAQVQSDWNATSGMGVILNKPTIPAATTVTQTLTSGTKIGEVNGVSLYAPEAGNEGIITETDPIFSASPAANITADNIIAWNSKSDFSGSYDDLSDKPTIPIVPTNVSAFTNDSGYLTSYTETDPTVPAWAKAESKPTYTASEVGAASSSHVHGNVKNDGTITVNTSMANGDRLLFSDTSDSSKIKNTSITIGTSTTQYLANNGTWQNLPTVSVSQTLTSGTEIGSVNNTKLYAPAPYDDSTLTARVTALEQLEWATYYSGRSNPSNSQGQNGDIYLQY